MHGMSPETELRTRGRGKFPIPWFLRALFLFVSNFCPEKHPVDLVVSIYPFDVQTNEFGN